MNEKGWYACWVKWRNSYRAYVAMMLATVAMLNAVIRFWGEWEYFYIALVGHLFFGQAIVAFLYDKPMIFGPGGADIEDGPGARGIAIIFSLIGYGVMFAFNGYPWS